MGEDKKISDITRLEEYNSHLAITVLLELVWQKGDITAEEFVTVLDYYDIEPLTYLN